MSGGGEQDPDYVLPRLGSSARFLRTVVVREYLRPSLVSPRSRLWWTTVGARGEERDRKEGVRSKRARVANFVRISAACSSRISASMAALGSRESDVTGNCGRCRFAQNRDRTKSGEFRGEFDSLLYTHTRELCTRYYVFDSHGLCGFAALYSIAVA